MSIGSFRLLEVHISNELSGVIILMQSHTAASRLYSLEQIEICAKI